MSELFVVGLNHQTAPLDLREKLAVSKDALRPVFETLRARGLAEELVVSTCNRVEIYGSADTGPAAAEQARALLAERAGADLDGMLYAHRGVDAVRHAFRVASSLDSMVVGEPQILGQVKEAYDLAQQEGAVGTLLGRCFTRAFAVAKRVRSETGIAEGTVSVSSIAVSLARKIFGELGGRRVMLLGAGEMGEAAARSLAGSGARLAVLNRSPEKAERLAEECHGEAIPYEQLTAELVRSDIVITSTSSPKYVLTVDVMQGVTKARRMRPLFIIDIAVPRDVDPRVHDMGNVFLYDVDDLQQVAEENLRERKRSAEAAERIVEVEVAEFEAWRRSLELTPTIVALRKQFAEIVKAEIARTTPRLGELTPKQRKSLDKMASAMVNKLLHAPLTTLKKGAGQPEGGALIEATRQLFDLDEGEESEAEERRRESERPRAAKPELAKG